MASPELRPVLIVLALAASACDARQEDAGQGSVTVKLPPARPYAPQPAFTFNSQNKPLPESDQN
ncbi:MAG TPA: hypothetical protein VM711_07080 [Sphingomicrobium sp.]|nr:hypothetical protein [Sphingomicrobium sp.]